MSSDTSTAAYFNSLAERIRAINSCAIIQALANEAMAEVETEIAAIEAKMEALLPLQELLSLPTDLKSLITWAGNVVNNIIKPLYAPYLKYVQDIAELEAALANLTSAIASAAANIENCSVTIPPVSLPAPASSPGASATQTDPQS